MKKKLLFFIIVFLTLCIFGINAQQGGFIDRDAQNSQGGFTGPSAGVTTVAQALRLRDDTPVILQGRILNSLGNDRYTFADNTGTITIEIERRAWGNLTVGPDDTVEISGEIDRDRQSIEVEVNTIRKL